MGEVLYSGYDCRFNASKCVNGYYIVEYFFLTWESASIYYVVFLDGRLLPPCAIKIINGSVNVFAFETYEEALALARYHRDNYIPNYTIYNVYDMKKRLSE